MTDEQLTLAVARALGMAVAKDWNGTMRTIPEGSEFRPLTDSKWAVTMMMWLAERWCEVLVTDEGCRVLRPDGYCIGAGDWNQGEKEAVLMRCLCEAVAHVGEGGQR